jgi:metal-responsive CopG/Arc/MetJ family transcriptional regulator
MHLLSLKLQEDIFKEADTTARTLKVSRNAYINDALRLYNTFNRRRNLKARLAHESRMVAGESLAVLRDFEKLVDA